MTDAVKEAAITSVQQHFETLPHRSIDEDNAALLEFLRTRSDFVEAGLHVESATLWGRFPDGEILAIFNNDLPPDVPLPSSPGPTPSPSAPSGSGSTLRISLDLPAGKRVVLVNAFSALDLLRPLTALQAFYTPSVGVAPQLGAAGYSVDGVGGDLLTLSQRLNGIDIAVLFGHGGSVPIGPGGQPVWVFASSSTLDSPISLAQALAFREHVGHALMFAKTDRQRLGTLLRGFFIKPSFVSEYWAFYPGSLALMNSCSSGATSLGSDGGPSDANAFIQAMADKGLYRYLGWSLPADTAQMADTSQLMFDTMLGSNVVRTLPAVARPFPVEDSLVVARLLQRPSGGLSFGSSEVKVCSDGTCRSEGLSLLKGVATSNVPPGQKGLLRPSIRELEPRDIEATGHGENVPLRIFGDFGPNDNGRVTLAGMPLTIVSWTDDEITCEIPPEVGGDVVVENGARSSNAVSLTVWRGTVTIDETLNDGQGTAFGDEFGTVRRSITAPLVWRADVHPYYEFAGDLAAGTPRYRVGTTLKSLLVQTPQVQLAVSGETQTQPSGSNGDYLVCTYSSNPPASDLTGYVVGNLYSRPGPSWELNLTAALGEQLAEQTSCQPFDSNGPRGSPSVQAFNDVRTRILYRKSFALDGSLNVPQQTVAGLETGGGSEYGAITWSGPITLEATATYVPSP